MISAIYLCCAAAVASASMPSIFPMYIDTRTKSSEVATPLRGIFPKLLPETVATEPRSELDILRGSLSAMTDAELRQLYAHSIVPDEIPFGLFESTAVKILGLRPATGWINHLYNGDEVFKRQCGDEEYNLGYIIVDGQRAAVGEYTIIKDVDDPFNSYQVGLVGDFTKRVPVSCNIDDGLITNSYPFAAMIDVWRQLPSNPRLLLGKAFLKWGAGVRQWAWLAAHVHDRDDPTAPQWAVPMDPNAVARNNFANEYTWGTHLNEPPRADNDGYWDHI